MGGVFLGQYRGLSSRRLCHGGGTCDRRQFVPILREQSDGRPGQRLVALANGKARFHTPCIRYITALPQTRQTYGTWLR